MQKVAPTTSNSDSADREVLLKLNRNYVRSALKSDVRWYSENLSEDFYITAPDGALLDREAFLKRIANPYPGTEAEAVDVTIRILGDFAIIHSGYRDKKLTGDTGYRQAAGAIAEALETSENRRKPQMWSCQNKRQRLAGRLV